METKLSKKLGLIAGDGELPVELAKSAKNSGFEIIAVSLSPDNRDKLKNCCAKVYSCGPGELQKIVDSLHKEEISQLSFIGKVHKGMLFRNPKLDSRALKLIMKKKKLNDDDIMLAVIEELSKENIEVIDQTIFLKSFFATKGVYGTYLPDEKQQSDIEYGFSVAKELGRLDIGQSVIVQNKMILALEAIEGTDNAIQRGAALGDGKAVVVKVSKPKQDKRFDIPTVGLNTLKIMKKFGAEVLAVEAGETFIVEKNEMIKFADKHKMVFIGI